MKQYSILRVAIDLNFYDLGNKSYGLIRYFFGVNLRKFETIKYIQDLLFMK